MLITCSQQSSIDRIAENTPTNSKITPGISGLPNCGINYVENSLKIIIIPHVRHAQ